MKTKKHSTIWCGLVVSALLSACSQIPVKETKVCGVAGVLQAGANCALTFSKIPEKESQMTFEEFVEFLEPQPERVVNGKKLPARGAALCQSADDWNAHATALQQACEKLKSACTYEMRKQIESVTTNLASLQKKNSAAKKGNTK